MVNCFGINYSIFNSLFLLNFARIEQILIDFLFFIKTKKLFESSVVAYSDILDKSKLYIFQLLLVFDKDQQQYNYPIRNQLF